jgi:hypothetical protein
VYKILTMFSGGGGIWGRAPGRGGGVPGRQDYCGAGTAAGTLRVGLIILPRMGLVGCWVLDEASDRLHLAVAGFE